MIQDKAPSIIIKLYKFKPNCLKGQNYILKSSAVAWLSLASERETIVFISWHEGEKGAFHPHLRDPGPYFCGWPPERPKSGAGSHP